MRILVLFVVLFVMFSCDSQSQQSSDKNAIEKLDAIKDKEEEINTLSKDLRPGQKVPTEMSDDLIDLLINFYQSYPENSSAPVCLDKLHMVYSAKRQYQKSANYGDTLLNNYPIYINRPMILESMAITYDIFILPRDTTKVRYYNELLLKEDKEMSQEKREEILFKLDNLNLSLDEMILKINK